VSTYRFRFSEEYLLELHLRYRRQLWWRKPFYAAKWLLAIPLVALGVFLIVKGWALGGGIIGAIVGAMFLGWPIDAWFIRRRFRKSPYHDEELTYELLDTGIHVTGKLQDVRLAWEVFTKARTFKDGVLVFQGPHVITWLPDSAIAAGSSTDEARELIRHHVKDYR
jgi:hypothetical protein